MKTSTFNIALLLVALITIQLPLKAEQVKKMHKSWPVNKVTSLTVENKFGNINFMNTRDDSVTIDVYIETENDSHRFGSSISELIDFSFSFEEGEIKAQTHFSEGFKTKKEFTIVYTINIPVNKNLNISNKFGNVTLTNLKANGKFEISYGNIFGNSIQAPNDRNIEIDLKYSKANFEVVNRLKAQIAYSKLRLNKIETAELETRYSNINIDNCENLNSDSQYDNFILGNLHTLRTNSKFTDWKIEEILTNAEFDTEYGDVNIGHVAKNFREIRIENHYGNMKIGIDRDASYNLKSETDYCDVIYPKTSPIKYFKDNNRTRIEAIIGSGNPTSKVNIESKYGKVDLME